jgi:hypothetical protein
MSQIEPHDSQVYSPFTALYIAVPPRLTPPLNRHGIRVKGLFD